MRLHIVSYPLTHTRVMTQVEIEVADWARVYVEELLPSQRLVVFRVNYSTEDPGIPEPPRFNVAEFYLAELRRKYAAPSAPFIVCHEMGHNDAKPNPHYHGFMELSAGVTIAAVREYIRRIWRGNESYSLKKATPKLTPGYFNYVCKGTGTGADDHPQIIHKTEHFSDEVLLELRRLYWSNNNKIQAVAGKKRKRKASASEEILTLCKEAHLDGKDRNAIVEIVFRYYRNNIKYLNPPYVRNLVWQTMCYLDPEGTPALDLKVYLGGNPYVDRF